MSSTTASASHETSSRAFSSTSIASSRSRRRASPELDWDFLSRATSSVFGLLKRTAEKGSREILLVEAQDEFVNPSQLFQAERL